ncbi:MAG: SDR family oxidoreductase [Odoribacter sp.]
MVFVTGATGLLGSHLLYLLAEKGNSIIALHRPQSDLKSVRAIFEQHPEAEQRWQQISWVEGDVLDTASLTQQIRTSTCVYHCAAVVSFSADDQQRLRETNLKGTEHIAALCLQHQVRLCYVSSIAALGDSLHPKDLIDETTPTIEGRAHSAYSFSKSDAEKIVWKYIKKGLNAVIVCPSIILGGGMWNKSSARLYLTAAKGIPFYTKGVSGYVDVRDVCQLMITLAEDTTVQGERFILNGGNYSYRELFATLAKANGKRPPSYHLSPWMTEMIWRLLSVKGWFSHTKPAFTKETARTAHHCSYYSNQKILTRYPNFHFYSLADTATHIRQMWTTEMKRRKGK